MSQCIILSFPKRIMHHKSFLEKVCIINEIISVTVPRVLVCRLESQNEDEQKRSTAQLESLRLRGLGVTSVVWVPRLQPITRTQYNRASGAWPTHFHEDKVYVVITVL